MIDPEAYADSVLRTAKPPIVSGEFNLQCLVHAAIGCASEAGELLDHVKRVSFYGSELDRTNVIEECGDLMWYLAYALRSVGATFDEAMSANQRKLEKRYPGGVFDRALSDNRDVVAERVALERSNR